MSPKLLNSLKQISVRCLRRETSKDVIREAGFDCILVTSHGAIEGKHGQKHRLALASLKNIHVGISWLTWRCAQPRYNPVLVFSACQHSPTKPFVGASRFESAVKAGKLDISGFKSHQFIDAGAITNSFTEMEAFRSWLVNLRVKHNRILIVTCELHSGAEYVLARMLFPDSEIMVVCNSAELEVEADHSTEDQRTWGRWLWCSWLRYIAFKVTSLSPPWLVRPWLFKKLRAAQHDRTS